MELTTLAQWTIRPRLMAVPGVADVAIWGQRDRQLQVLVDPERLRRQRRHARRGAARRRRRGGSVRGGFVDTPNQRLAVRQSRSGTIRDALARALVVVPGGAPLRLGDVTRGGRGPAASDRRRRRERPAGPAPDRREAAGGNTLAITRGVETALAALAPGLADVEVDSQIFRPATFIEQSIANLRSALLVGSLLVALVLFAFFQEPRAALISLVTLPLSLRSRCSRWLPPVRRSTRWCWPAW